MTGKIALEADLHVHTISSGHGYSTVREICQVAFGRGIRMVGIADHGPAMPGAPHLYHFSNLIVLPRELSGVKILRGAECNILDEEGRLDIPDRVLEVLDVVHAGLHPRCGYEGKGVEENTRAVLAALGSGKVDVLVHPGNPLYPLDYGKVARAAASSGVLLEINNASFTVVRKGSEVNCRRVLEEAKRSGARICIGSDAHEAELVGVFDKALELVESVTFDIGYVVNRTAETVLDFIKTRGKEITL